MLTVMESVWCPRGEHLNNKCTVKDLHICFRWAVCSSVCSSVFADQLFLFPRTRFKLSSTDEIKNLFCGDIIADRVNRLFIISVVCFIYQDFFLISIPRSKRERSRHFKSAFHLSAYHPVCSENFILQGQLCVLTLISASVPPPCYRSST